MEETGLLAAGTVIGAATLSLDPTGVPNLDLVLGGGLLRGSLVSVVGPPGCGKTTLASQVAFASARTGRTVLILITLSEPTSKLLAHLRGYQFYDPTPLGGRVQVFSLQQFLPTGLASTATDLTTITRASGASLVVLDGFSGVRAADPSPGAARQFLFNLGTSLSLLGATTIITSEAQVRDPDTFPEGTTADTILGLHFGVLAGIARQQGDPLVDPLQAGSDRPRPRRPREQAERRNRPQPGDGTPQAKE